MLILEHDTITSPYIVQPCTPNSIPGCMDPGYTEYNPQANVNDSVHVLLQSY